MLSLETLSTVFLLYAVLVAVFAGGLLLRAFRGPSLPVALLIGFQVYRVGVELVVANLHELGFVPKLLTLSGGNVDLLVALSAPAIAWIATRGSTGLRIAQAWNVMGLLSVLNVSARAVLSSGAVHLIHTEVPTVAFAMFPFGLVPAFIVPLAIALHVAIFRALRAARLSTDPRSIT